MGELGVFYILFFDVNRIWFPSSSKHHSLEESEMEDPSFTLTMVNQIPPESQNVFFVNKLLEIFQKIIN